MNILTGVASARSRHRSSHGVFTKRIAATIAVITATSAAEVALSEAATRGLEHAGRSARETRAILKGVNGLIDLYRVNSAFPAGLPVSLGRVMTKLAVPRNEAAHAGATPRQGVVGEAIGTAKALVMIAPVPTPDSIE